MKIIPIVEGHGDERAVPVLLRKLLHEWHGQYDLRIDTPVRRHRDELAKPDGIRRWVRTVRMDPECAAIIVLFDADDDNAADLKPLLEAAGAEVAGSTPVYVAIAVREYEAWLLASVESLQGRAGLKPDPVLPTNGPESVRDAKGWVERNMIAGRTYAETVDQEKLTALLDPRAAYRNSPSFRSLFDDMADLVKRLGRIPAPMET
jgi:hypothetical protein